MAAEDAKRQEERVKLFATALSNVGVAAIVAGFISPLVGGRAQAFTAIASLFIGMGLHFGGQVVLHYVVGDATPSAITASRPEEEQ